MSQKFVARIALLEHKLGMARDTQTIVHRASLRAKPSLAHSDTGLDVFSGRTAHNNGSPTTTASSSSRTPRRNIIDWSPLSQASTPATSFNSSASRYRRYTPEHVQTKSASAGGDDLLPPIEEDCGRLITIPVQEVPINVEPSVMTVESAAAAKIYFETHFERIMVEPSSPRSLRRKQLEQQMRELDMPHNERLSARRQWTCVESENLRQTRALKATSLARHNIKGKSIAGFNMIRVLGKGSFGVVRLVKEQSLDPFRDDGGDDLEQGTRSSGTTTCVSGMDGTALRNIAPGERLADVFAMKVIRKSDMLRACQEGHLRAERDFLVGAEGSRWVVPLIASFQDSTNLYLVMEYMIGGDFLGLLLREDVLEEEVAR